MPASVIIRARDEAASIGRLLALLAAQDAPHEVLVVDSGSRDGTPDIARAAGVRVLDLAPGRFTFGRALNLGAAAADPAADVLVALSAHAFPRDPGWLGRVVAWFDDAQVACCCGEAADPAFRPLDGPLRQDHAHALAHPYWGYSNGAGAVRAALWRERPFREDLPGTEDREWALWALARGGVCVLDPALVVDHDHARDPLRVAFERYAREARGYALFRDDLGPYGARELAGEWWGDQGGHRSRARARLDPRRAARLLGKWHGRRTPRPDPRA